MSPLFMDTGHESNSPGSLSAEEYNSNTAGSEREGEGQVTVNRGTKRRQKNRDAARKSRRKQTERADELHEELQCLEQSSSALRKEIAALKKDVHLYTMALERHEPFCSLRASGSSSTNRLSVSPTPVDAMLPQNCSSPPKNPPQTSYSSLAASPSLSTSLTPITPMTCHHAHDCVDNTHLSPSPSSRTPAELFTTSSSSSAMAVPFSVAAPHSLFSEKPPSLITSRPANAALTPLCASLISNPISSTVAQPLSEQDSHESSSMSANALLHINSPALLPSSHTAPSTLHSGVLDALLVKQASFQTASSNVVPPYSPATENAGLAAQSFPMNVPQLLQCQFNGNPKNSSPPCIRLTSPLQDPALQSLSGSPQANQNPSPTAAFALKPNYSQQMTPTPASLLSLLTVPSPLNVPQTTSSSSDGLLAQPSSSLPPLSDLSKDLYLSELLEINDWILNGTSNQ